MSFIKSIVSVVSGLRKFVIMSAVILIGSGFRLADLLNGAEFIDLIKITVVSYMSTNAAEHLTSTIKDWLKTKSQEVLKKKE